MDQVGFGRIEFVVCGVEVIRDVGRQWVSEFICRGRGEGWRLICELLAQGNTCASHRKKRDFLKESVEGLR